MERRKTISVYDCPCTNWQQLVAAGELVEGHHPKCPVAVQIRKEIVAAESIMTGVVYGLWFGAGALLAVMLWAVFGN